MHGQWCTDGVVSGAFGWLGGVWCMWPTTILRGDNLDGAGSVVFIVHGDDSLNIREVFCFYTRVLILKNKPSTLISCIQLAQMTELIQRGSTEALACWFIVSSSQRVYYYTTTN